MIVRFFKTGLSRGEPPVNYILGEKDHEGDTRYTPPQILEGNPAQTIRLINQCTRKHKYASGVLAFRPEEQVTPNQLTTILDKFRDTIAPGIGPEQYQCLFVLHKDPIDKKTGNHPFHVHFVIPMTFLGGETHNGKALAGKRFNPHPPGQKSQETMALFASTVNHENGWKQVVEDPMRLGIDSFWRKIDGKTNERKVDLLGQELIHRVKKGVLANRNELISFIENDLGCAITRKSDSYISVRLPHMTKSIRLKGKLFEAKTDYAREFATHSPSNSRTVSTLTVPEYDQAKARLQELLEERKPVLLGFRPKASTTNRKETYGAKQITREDRQPTRTNEGRGHEGRNERSSTPHGIRHESHSRHDRDLESTVRHSVKAESTLLGYPPRREVGVGQRVRPTDTEIGASPTGQSSSTRTAGQLPTPDQGAGCRPSGGVSQPSERPDQSTSLSSLLLRSVNSAAEINDQLRQLGMALSNATYAEQTSIQNQINTLIGKRERLPAPK